MGLRLELVTADGEVEREVSTGPGLVVGCHIGDLTFGGDPWMSSPHLRVEPARDGLVVTDLNSTEGVYVEVTEPHGVHLQFGDHLLVGAAHFRLDEPKNLPRWAPVDIPPEQCQGSRRPPAFGVLSEILDCGRVGTRTVLDTEETFIGLGMAQVLLDPQDPFASSGHASLLRVANRIVLSDLGSKTGTYLRMREPRSLVPRGGRFRAGSRWFRAT